MMDRARDRELTASNTDGLRRAAIFPRESRCRKSGLQTLSRSRPTRSGFLLGILFRDTGQI